MEFAGVVAHLPDAKGLRDLAMLLTVPGQDVHVFTLLGRSTPSTGADPMLDHEAKRRYRRRILELRDVIERADHDGDVDASQAAANEIDALHHEIVVSTGIGGRDRRLGDEVERARKTVSARVRDSLNRIAATHPALGTHLAHSISLGSVCSYRPSDVPAWQL